MSKIQYWLKLYWIELDTHSYMIMFGVTTETLQLLVSIIFMATGKESMIQILYFPFN